jgi:hypothetical protein
MTSSQQIPAVWGTNVEILTGVDLIDKAELIGVPFLITEVEFKPNKDGIEYAWVTAMDKDGKIFQFNDSTSTGIRAQLIQYLKDRGQEGIVDTHEKTPMSLAILNGLRRSNYTVKVMGKDKASRTYYLRYSTED